MEPGESLAESLSVLKTAAFVNVVFLAGGVVILARSPFGLQGESLICSGRRTMAALSSLPLWWHRPAWHPRSTFFSF
jgi:hypothetical protein